MYTYLNVLQWHRCFNRVVFRRCLDEDVGKTSSQDEAQQQHELHQSFLGELDEHQRLYDKLTSEASHLHDKPQVSTPGV